MLKISTAKTTCMNGKKLTLKPFNWFRRDKKNVPADFDPIMNLFGFIGEIAVKR